MAVRVGSQTGFGKPEYYFWLTTQTACRKSHHPAGKTQPEGESEGLQTSFGSWIGSAQIPPDKLIHWNRFYRTVGSVHPGILTHPLEHSSGHRFFRGPQIYPSTRPVLGLRRSTLGEVSRSPRVPLSNPYSRTFPARWWIPAFLKTDKLVQHIVHQSFGDPDPSTILNPISFLPSASEVSQPQNSHYDPPWSKRDPSPAGEADGSS
jgi:hypothetical protein